MQVAVGAHKGKQGIVGQLRGCRLHRTQAHHRREGAELGWCHCLELSGTSRTALGCAGVALPDGKCRQLNEVLVDFWSNHFNIDVKKSPCHVLKIADDRDAVFLDGAIQPAPATYTASFRDGRWSINGGATNGIPAPAGSDAARLALFPFDAAADTLADPARALAHRSWPGPGAWRASGLPH